MAEHCMFNKITQLKSFFNQFGLFKDKREGENTQGSVQVSSILKTELILAGNTNPWIA